MSEHTHRTIERHVDVAVVGGSAAGLAAALQLGRQRRSVLVIDDGRPRNAPAAHMHGYLGLEGVPPAELAARARDEVRGYGAEVLSGRVESVVRSADGRLRLSLTGGHGIVARKLVIATGLVDELPALEGIDEHWGRDVVHCPFCHGFEVRDRRVVHLVEHRMGLHVVPLFRRLTDRLVVVLADEVADEPELVGLRAAGVTVEHGRASRLVTGADGRVEAVELADGRLLAADAVAVGPRFGIRAEPFAALGLAPVPHASGLGEHVATDLNGETGVPDVYAAGNVTDPGQQVLHAAANGSRVGAMVAMALATEDVAAATRTAPNEADWDHRYGGEQMWSGNPNGALVAEVADLPIGRVLDVGAGEGGDAVWLAERGWTVTATDVSANALARVSSAAEARGVAVTCRHLDANALDPFEHEAYDLVAAQYASIPRTPDDRAVRNLLSAVAPGGRLLVVGHDLEPMRQPVDTARHSRMFDPDAFVRVVDVARVLAQEPGWVIERHEHRARPAGAVSSHHVDDEVLRARRLG